MVDVCPFCGAQPPPYATEEYPFCAHQVAIWEDQPVPGSDLLSGENQSWYGNECLRHASDLQAAVIRLMNAIVWPQGPDAEPAEAGEIASRRAAVQAPATREGAATPSWISAWKDWLEEYSDRGQWMDPERAGTDGVRTVGTMVEMILREVPGVAVCGHVVHRMDSSSFTYVWAAEPDIGARAIDESIVAATRLLDAIAARLREGGQ